MPVRTRRRRSGPPLTPAWVAASLALLGLGLLWLGVRREPRAPPPRPARIAVVPLPEPAAAPAPRRPAPARRPTPRPLPPPQARDERLAVVPTADTPLVRDGNALWCVTMELAWRELAQRAFGGMPRAEPHSAAVGRLARAPRVALPAGRWYAHAAPRTATEMQRAVQALHARFPEAFTPPLGQPGPGWFSLAYLEVALHFGHAFARLPDALPFADGVGVQAFGLGPEDVGRLHEARRQVAVLYDARLDRRRDAPPGGVELSIDPAWEEEFPSRPFVLDLDRDSAPSQLLVAQVERAASLRATWERVAALLARGRALHGGAPRGLDVHDTLAVPRMDWTLTKRFEELRGRALVGPNGLRQPVDEALQATRLKLDERGVEMASLAVITTRGAGGRAYPLRRPFLLALRKRGAELPYLLLWLEDARLLQPFREADASAGASSR